MNKAINYDNLSKKELNKIAKRQRLIDSAYNCFITKGYEKTTIGDITEGANVAKGTFYLYFKDKTQVQNVVTLYKSYSIIQKCLEKSREKALTDKTDSFIYFINEILDYLDNNRDMLKTIYSNLSKGLFNEILNQEGYEREKDSVEKIVEDFTDTFSDNMEKEEAEKVLFIILEMIGAVSYNAIMFNEPDSMDKMKPILFNCIKKILK